MLDANRLDLRPQNIRGILQEQPAALGLLGVTPHPRKTENSDGDRSDQRPTTLREAPQNYA